MQFSIAERLNFGSLLPSEGDFITLTLKHDIIAKVRITQDEIAEWEIRSDDGSSFKWNAEKAKEKEISFTDAETALIVRTLKELDSSKKLNDMTFGLYRKFI